MKRILRIAAGAATAVSISSASTLALDATNTWRGSILVTNVTTQCALPGFPGKGATLLAVFRPKLTADQSNSALLTTFSNGALLVTLNSTVIPAPSTGSYTGDVLGGLATYGHYAGKYAFAISPSAVTATTPQITMRGTIAKFRNTAGCNVTFKGSFFQGVI